MVRAGVGVLMGFSKLRHWVVGWVLVPCTCPLPRLSIQSRVERWGKGGGAIFATDRCPESPWFGWERERGRAGGTHHPSLSVFYVIEDRRLTWLRFFLRANFSPFPPNFVIQQGEMLPIFLILNFHKSSSKTGEYAAQYSPRKSSGHSICKFFCYWKRGRMLPNFLQVNSGHSTY